MSKDKSVETNIRLLILHQAEPITRCQATIVHSYPRERCLSELYSLAHEAVLEALAAHAHQEPVT